MGPRRHVVELKKLRGPLDRPVRVDAVLRARYPEVSRRDLARAIAAGLVTVNGRPARKGAYVQPGDRIVVGALEAAPPPPLVDIPVLYADETVLAVDKPAGIAAVARRVGGQPSVAAYLLALLPDLARVGRSALEGGLAHRLDAGTSGVLLAARSRVAWQHLRRQFAAHAVVKEYLALVHGVLRAPRNLEHRLGHRTSARAPLAVAGTAAVRRRRLWVARAGIHPVAARSGFSLVRVRLDTGVTHQIRVQLAAIGHPVVGDVLYGAAPAPDLAHGRFLLHSARVGFTHPGTGEPTTVVSPLPADFQRALARLGLTEKPPRGTRGGAPAAARE